MGFDEEPDFTDGMKPVELKAALHFALNELAALRVEVERLMKEISGLMYERTFLRSIMETSTLEWIDCKLKERDDATK